MSPTPPPLHSFLEGLEYYLPRMSSRSRAYTLIRKELRKRGNWKKATSNHKGAVHMMGSRRHTIIPIPRGAPEFPDSSQW